MPLDGLSFSNSGLYKIITPTEAFAQVEQVAKQQSETLIKKTESSENIKSELKEKGKDEDTDLQGRDTEDNDEPDESGNSGFLDNHEKIKKYKVKFNQLTDMVELVDHKTGFVVETISPQDLVSLISKSKGSSGILVDREI